MAKTAQDGPDSSGARSTSSVEDQLVREGDVAGDYLERLLDVLDYDGDIDLDVEAGRAIVSIDGGDDLDKLVGDRGAVLEALQELTRLAVQQSLGNRSRLMLDIAGWRRSRRDELTELGTRTAKEVLDSGEAVRLRPMTPFERKVVHDAVAGIKGVVERERGRGAAAPGRRLAQRLIACPTPSPRAPVRRGPRPFPPMPCFTWNRVRTRRNRCCFTWNRVRTPSRRTGTRRNRWCFTWNHRRWPRRSSVTGWRSLSAMRHISSVRGSSGGCSGLARRPGSGSGTSSTVRSSRSCSRTAHGRWTSDPVPGCPGYRWPSPARISRWYSSNRSRVASTGCVRSWRIWACR